MDRTATVSDLVHLRRPLPDVLSELRSFPWDSDEELVSLGVAELSAVLRAFLDGHMTSTELEQWANAVEGRDDIGFESQAVVDRLNELANPELFGGLTAESIHKMLRQLAVE